MTPAQRLPELRAEARDVDLYKLEDIAVDTYRTTGNIQAAKAVLIERLQSRPSEKTRRNQP